MKETSGSRITLEFIQMNFSAVTVTIVYKKNSIATFNITLYKMLLIGI